MHRTRSCNWFYSTQLATLSLLLGSASTFAASSPTPAERPPCQQTGQPFGHRLLEHLGEQLKLSSEQQPAWAALIQAWQARREPTPPPLKSATLVDLARAQAEHARAEAQRQASISQATQKLWSVLTPEQQHAFDRMARPILLQHHHGFQPPHLAPADARPPEMD